MKHVVCRFHSSDYTTQYQKHFLIRVFSLVLFVHSLMLYYLNFLVLLQFRFFLVDLILQLVVLNH
ncbi:Uncharacterised protein [Streptococcus pneumoniae]|nr:Uncharacterised protein [Streptococcus pneumoniae]